MGHALLANGGDATGPEQHLNVSCSLSYVMRMTRWPRMKYTIAPLVPRKMIFMAVL